VIERLISFAAPAADGYGSVVIAGETAAAWARSREGEAEISNGAGRPGSGALRVSGPAEAGDLVLGISALTSPLAFEAAAGLRAQVQALQVSAEHPRLGALEGPGVAWSFDLGELEGGAPAALRCLWAGSERGLLVGFAVRPGGADDHGSEGVGFARIARNGAVTAFDEPLLSTEYDAAGRQRRATLELWPEEGAAERGGGRCSASGRAELGDRVLDAAAFSWRVSGEAAIGGYDIVRG
jgi:hypothetical protein